jgi:iron complex transport system ATP-binding protein
MIGLDRASVAFGSRTLFKDISFSVPVGRSMAILGPYGRGKTTLLRALLGFQPLASGTRRAEVAGYVPQHGASQAKLSGLDVVVMGRAVRLGLFGQPSPPTAKRPKQPSCRSAPAGSPTSATTACRAASGRWC